MTTHPPETLNRSILRLALPALGALIAEPLFLIVDAAMVGHLGVAPLAGLGIAGAVLQTIVGLMVFLAYSTTPAVARRYGAGEYGRAVRVGIDGMWLALCLGALLAAAGSLVTPAVVDLFGAAPDVAENARTYLAISMWGLPAMLVVFAATGLLRGMQNTVTPLWIAGLGFGANALLNALFIYGFGWGIAGSAIGTVVAQWGWSAPTCSWHADWRGCTRHPSASNGKASAARCAPAAGCSCARSACAPRSWPRSPSPRVSARRSSPAGRSRSRSSRPPRSRSTPSRSPLKH